MTSILQGIPGLIGGAMIGSAMSLCCRSAKKGAQPNSSIFNCFSIDPESKWKSSFVAGMIFAASLLVSIFGLHEIESVGLMPFEKEKLFFKGTGLIQFMVSGFLIGFGLRLSSSDLNSYAFCGVPRLSSSSIVATAVALIFAAVVATLRSSFPFLQGVNLTKKFNEHLDFRLSILVPILMIVYNLFRNYKDKNVVRELLKSFGVGALLAAGMIIAGFAKRHQVLGALSLNKHWNPSLIFAIAGAVGGNIIMSTMYGDRSLPNVGDISKSNVGVRSLVGSAIFGTGLGISGLTPGAGLIVSAVYVPQVILFFMPFILIGQFAGGFIAKLNVGTQKAANQKVTSQNVTNQGVPNKTE